MNIAIYSLDSGQILRFVECSPNQVAGQIQRREEFFLNCPRTATHIENYNPVEQIDLVFLEHKVKSERNMKLLMSDWTQMPDVPLTPEQKTAWAYYRQQLRDFPVTCDLTDIVWPAPPQ